jgi:hypothetical protein
MAKMSKSMIQFCSRSLAIVLRQDSNLWDGDDKHWKTCILFILPVAFQSSRQDAVA